MSNIEINKVLHSVFEGLDQLFIILDRNFKIVHFNSLSDEVFPKVFQTSLSKGMSVYDFVKMENREVFGHKLNQCLDGLDVQFTKEYKKTD